MISTRKSAAPCQCVPRLIGLRVAKEHGYVGLAEVLLPAFFPVAEVHAGEYVAKLPGRRTTSLKMETNSNTSS